MRISEVELLPDLGSSRDWRHSVVVAKTNPYAGRIRSGAFQRIAKVKDHTIYHMPVGYPVHSLIIAVNDSTGLVDMRLSGVENRRKDAIIFQIKDLDGRSGSSLKAYEFYHAILKKMPIVLTTDKQSYGGLRTWQELARYPDVEVFGWDRGQPVNVSPLDPDDTHVTKHDQDARLMKMKLVAHRKLGKTRGN